MGADYRLGSVPAVWCPAFMAEQPHTGFLLFCLSAPPTLQPSNPSCLLSPMRASFVLHLFVPICLALLLPTSRSLCLPLSCRCTLCLKKCVCFSPLPVAVVLRILPHSQPGPERLRVLLQDQGAEKEVAGAVRHGHVSVWLCVYVIVRQCDQSTLGCHSIGAQHVARPVLQVGPLDDEIHVKTVECRWWHFFYAFSSLM